MQMLRGMFGILMTLLNSPRPVTRKKLAEKFEISERTVSRYIDAMSADCDIPVTASYGTGGGYSLADSYRLNQTYFTKDEYNRILACLGAVDGELDDEIMLALRDKFVNLKSNLEGEKFLLSGEKLVIDSTAWLSPNEYRNTMSAISKAIDEMKTVTLDYIDKRDSRTKRDFDPYTLVLKEGVWYVYGWCRVRNDFRLFKLSRIKSLVITDKTYERSSDGDVHKKLKEQFIDRDTVNIRIECDGEALPAVEEWLGFESVKEKGDGLFEAEGYVYSEDLLVKKLLSFGSHVKVLSPSFVAEELLTEIKRAARLYE